MRFVLCDDEPYYRQLLHEMIVRDSFACDHEVEVTEYDNAKGLLAAVEDGLCADAFFLDIQMEKDGADGIALGRRLRERGERGLIVYITAFWDYVQTGYEVRAFRYLLKSQLSEKLPEVLRDIRQELAGWEYAFQKGKERVRLDRRDIWYLESRGRLVHLFTAEGEYSFYGNLDREEGALGEQFLRCHRSYLVNCRKIQSYSTTELVLQNGSRIPVSRSYAKRVRQRLMLEMV